MNLRNLLTLLVVAIPAALMMTHPVQANGLARESTLCLYPVEIPIDEQTGEERRSRIEKRVIDALVEAGYTIPDPSTVDELNDRIKEEIGGYIDPAMGYKVSAKYKEFRESLAVAFADELGCSARLFVRVGVWRAYFENGRASWDGTEENVNSMGRQILNGLAGVSESGWTTATSIWFHATDLEGNTLSFRSAGIETHASFAVLRDSDSLPEDLWLTDSAKINRAIKSALGPSATELRVWGTPIATPEFK